MSSWSDWGDEEWVGNPPAPADYLGTGAQWQDRVAFMQRKILGRRPEGRTRTGLGRVTPSDIAAERRRKQAVVAAGEKLLQEAQREHEIRDEILAEVDRIEAEKAAAQLTRLHRLQGTGPITSPPEPALQLSSIKVGDEPCVYGRGSDHSWLRDRFLTVAFARGAVPNRRKGDAPKTVADRLRRNARQMQDLARHDKASGDLLRAYYTERSRPFHNTSSDRSKRDFADLALADFRAVTTGATSMGAVVPPVFLLSQTEIYRTAAAPAAARARHLPLPATGMEVNIPALTAAVDVNVQSQQNTAPGGSTPTSLYRTAQVATLVGEVPVSQQVLDRVGPGVTFDEIVSEQCARTMGSTLDGLVLDAILSGAQSITNSGSAGIPSLWADVGRGSALLKTTEGTRLPPDTLLMPPTNSSWFTAQVDKQTRPVWLPSPGGAGARAGEVTSASEGFSGYTVGGADVYEDDNLQPTGTDATLVLGNFGRGALVMVGSPIVDVFPTWQPAELTALVRFRSYVAVMALFPRAFCKISGAAYPVAPTFTGS